MQLALLMNFGKFFNERTTVIGSFTKKIEIAEVFKIISG